MGENDLADWGFATLTPDLILDAVEQAGFDPDGHILALNSYENRVYQIGCIEGPMVVVKFYRPNRWNTAQIDEENRFIAELADAEIDVVAPLFGDNDGQLVREHAGFYYVIYPKRAGRALELDNAEQLYRIGQLIGRMHVVARAKSFRYRPKVSLEEFGVLAQHNVLQSQLLDTELINVYEGVSEHLLQLIAMRFEALTEVNHIRLHGDLHASNVLVRDERFVLVDFDDARSGPAVQDLWMLVAGEGGERRAAWSELLEGYEQFCCFDQRQLQLIESLRGLRILHHAGWLSKRWQEPAFQQAFPWFGQSAYWQNHILAIREQIAAIEEDDWYGV